MVVKLNTVNDVHEALTRPRTLKGKVKALRRLSLNHNPSLFQQTLRNQETLKAFQDFLQTYREAYENDPTIKQWADSLRMPKKYE